jgi:LysR family transcriptional regulator, benzoate and cis,cis-muconate-responsive activator of ben and cat genes
MELRHLRYFVIVAEEQNITRAAARLHVSQPPLSRQIRDLEMELGVALFERSARSLRLTDAGRVFLIEARAVLTRANEAVHTVKAVASGQEGEIHVGYAPSLTVELLPHALREFQKLLPGVRVALHDASTEEMLTGLKRGELHAAMMPRPGTKALAGLNFDEMRRYNVSVAAHPTHPIAARRTVSLEMLADERLLGYTHADYPEYHDWISDLFSGLGRRPVIAEEHDSATSLVAAVETGRGVAIVPQSFSCFAGARLELRPIRPTPDPIVVGLVLRKSASIPPAVSVFMQAARSAAQIEGKR